MLCMIMRYIYFCSKANPSRMETAAHTLKKIMNSEKNIEIGSETEKGNINLIQRLT